MPKAKAKSKHSQAAPRPRDKGHRVPPTATSKDPAPAPLLQNPQQEVQIEERSARVSSRDERRRDKALQKLCSKAAAAAAPVATEVAPLAPTPQQVSAVLPDQISLHNCPIAVSPSDLWGQHPPSTPQLTSVQQPALPANFHDILARAIQQSLAVCTSQPASSDVQQLPIPEASQRQTGQHQDPEDDLVSSLSSHDSYQVFEEVPERFEDELSEDEGLIPDQPPFTGLFPPALFNSLIFKAINTAGLGPSPDGDAPSSSKDHSSAFFAEPSREVRAIPTPPLFLNILKKQWSNPGTGPNPSAQDRKYFNLSSEMTSQLQLPSVDPPIVALLPSSNVPGDPEEHLRPEDRRSDQSLQRVHQSSSWAIRAATTASFINRSTLLWLQELSEKLPTDDPRIQLDLAKITAALKFSADATMNSVRFSSKAMASAVSARRLLWLRHWQADARHKWRLASSPFEGGRLFGSILDPLLAETRDKRKFLPSAHRKSDTRPSPYRRYYHRSSDWGSGLSRSGSYFGTRFRPQADRGTRGRGPQGRRPFRGGGSRLFRRHR